MGQPGGGGKATQGIWLGLKNRQEDGSEIPLRTTLTSLVVAAFGLILLQAHGTQGKEVTLTGEVVDLQCYLVHPDDSIGAPHAKCARACINRGLPAGFLSEDGKLYPLIGLGHESVKGPVADLAATRVTIQGVLTEQNGIKAIQLKEVQSTSGQ